MPTDSYPTIASNGYLWCPFIVYPMTTSVSVSGQLSGTTNAVYGMYMHVPYKLTITKASSFVASGAAVAGAHLGVGLYDLAGNRVVSATLSWATGAPTSPSATVDQGSVTLAGGSYYFCWSTDNTTIKITTSSLMQWSFMRNLGLARITPLAANSSAAGVMPSTLGVLSAIPNNTITMPPPVLFHN